MFDEDGYEIMHYGTPRHSGRYPWGSGGDDANTRNKTLLDHIAAMRKAGMSDPDIAKGLDMTTTRFRALNSIAKNQQRQEKIAQVEKLAAKGMSNVAIGKRMGIPESSVRSLRAPGAKEKADTIQLIADMVKEHVDRDLYVDVGKGVENHLGISKEKLQTAIQVLQEQGYKMHYVKVKQLGTRLETTIKVLSKPDVPYSEVFANRANIKTITDFSTDGGKSFNVIQFPKSIAAKRIAVRYAEEGGALADGVLYVRPGVPDVSIGSARYAQVRVAVNGTHYLKGMAIYKDDLPEGVDIMFNTNKSKTANKLDALKELKKLPDGRIDPDNPFGAQISRQLTKTNSKGEEVLTSTMNILSEEGRWDTWSRTLSSQVLSKQSPVLAKEQLDMTYEQKRFDLNDIKALTNPAVKRLLLEKFADEVDSSAVHLEAARLPRSSWHVILPINSLKENEVYAPNFENGERVALIRYPHAGTFEIPELTVNNKNREARSLLGPQAPDAVGIHAKVAERLSGADFDGDTVLVIPNNRGRIQSTAPLEGLKRFNAKDSFAPYDGMPTIDGGIYRADTGKVDYGSKNPNTANKHKEMGKISNLITDMTIKGASTQELAQAVRHSMVVIDAEKHTLDYKRSSIENGIPALVKKYQAKPDGTAGGAATLISRAGSEVRVFDRKARPAAEGGPIDRATGKRMFVETGKTRLNPKTGKLERVTVESEKLRETDDAFTLTSKPGTKIESVYAQHSNRLKSLANEARKEYINTTPRPISRSAKEHYADDVKRLNAALNVAQKHAPIERQAQLLANAQVAAKRAANPNMDAATRRKIESQALATARTRMGGGKERIVISPREWEAIQAGAISNHKLEQILSHADLDTVRKLATPKDRPEMGTAKTLRAKQMIDSGFTQAEIASHLGVSVSTLNKSLGGDEE